MNAFFNGLLAGWLNMSLKLGLWASRNPRQYWPVALTLSLASWYVGAQYGSWDVLGILKFFGTSLMFGMFVGSPTLCLAQWLFNGHAKADVTI